MHEICMEKWIPWLPLLLNACAIAHTGAVLPFYRMENERDTAKAMRLIRVPDYEPAGV